MTGPKHSPTYDVVARAMAERKRLVCSYNGRHRVICPYILGHTDGEEAALVYQTCVRIVDLDVNPLNPYSPKRQRTSLLRGRKSRPCRG